MGLDTAKQTVHCRECGVGPFSYGVVIEHLLTTAHLPAYQKWLMTALLAEGYHPEAGQAGRILAALDHLLTPEESETWVCAY